MANAHELARGHSRLRALIEFAVGEGWHVKRTAGGHLKFTKSGCAAIYTSSTASDHRAALNARAQIRRAERETRSQAQGAAMTEITSQQMAGKLLASGFERSGPSATTLSDPIADTPMVVTLDQLRPYDHDPRKKRNPVYEEIKASIRERGLDAAPAITRRPGDDHYIIRNGGNTRLAILRELWSETKDERFFRVSCLFRPWPERGEIVALTGHLAENELRGGLTFIERALGVEKAREFYELESGSTLSQSELARRLAADGYPVQQSHISRMADAVRYLLPAIPTVLYAGLGRHQVERLSVMRKACERTWAHYAKGRSLVQDFDEFFQEVLSQFDVQADEFSAQRIQDELIGQMTELLGVDYDVLALDMTESESRQRALVSEPTPPSTPPALPEPEAIARPPADTAPPAARPTATPSTGESDAEASHSTRSARRQMATGFRSTSSRRRRQRNGLSPSSAWSPTSWAMHCRTTSRRMSCSPSRCRLVGSIRSRMSGTSPPAWTHPSTCASTSRSLPARLRARHTWASASMTVQKASASPAVPIPQAWRQRAVPSMRCWLAWPVSSPPASVWTTGNSSSTCRRCCTARAT